MASAICVSNSSCTSAAPRSSDSRGANIPDTLSVLGMRPANMPRTPPEDDRALVCADPGVAAALPCDGVVAADAGSICSAGLGRGGRIPAGNDAREVLEGTIGVAVRVPGVPLARCKRPREAVARLAKPRGHGRRLARRGVGGVRDARWQEKRKGVCRAATSAGDHPWHPEGRRTADPRRSTTWQGFDRDDASRGVGDARGDVPSRRSTRARAATRCRVSPARDGYPRAAPPSRRCCLISRRGATRHPPVPPARRPPISPSSPRAARSSLRPARPPRDRRRRAPRRRRHRPLALRPHPEDRIRHRVLHLPRLARARLRPTRQPGGFHRRERLADRHVVVSALSGAYQLRATGAASEEGEMRAAVTGAAAAWVAWCPPAAAGLSWFQTSTGLRPQFSGGCHTGNGFGRDDIVARVRQGDRFDGGGGERGGNAGRGRMTTGRFVQRRWLARRRWRARAPRGEFTRRGWTTVPGGSSDGMGSRGFDDEDGCSNVVVRRWWDGDFRMNTSPRAGR